MKVIRYFIVGGIAGVVDLGLYTIFAIYLGFHYLYVACFTFLAATTINYLLSIRHVFESGARFSKEKEYSSFSS